MEQIIFPFDAVSDFSLEDFLVLPTNADAFEVSTMLYTQSETFSGAVLYGMEGVGKTHLAHIAARFLNISVLSGRQIVFPKIFADMYVIDDVHLANEESQENLFHVFNHVQKSGGKILFTSQVPVAQFDRCLPDLKSRLLTLPQIEILPPKEAQLEVFLVKFASDHQLHLEPAVVKYILTRTGRSLSALKQVLLRLDQASLQHHKAVTVPFVKEVLGF